MKTMAYYTRENVCVDKRIENGKTKKFAMEERAKAEAYAKQIRSYVYELMFESRRTKRHQIGWAVPK